jgi:hypothetical protein
MIDLPTISVVIAASSVVIGVINSILSSRRSARNEKLTLETRQAQLFMQLYNRFHNKEFWEYFNEFIYGFNAENPDEFMEKYGPINNPEAFSKMQSVMSYFFGIGVLIKRRLIDVDLVFDLMPKVVFSFWEKTAPMIEVWGEEDPRVQVLNYLYEEMKKKEKLR